MHNKSNSRMHKAAASVNHSTLPMAFASIGTTINVSLTLFITALAGRGIIDMLTFGLMNAALAAPLFYYAGVSVLKGFGLPRETTFKEFNWFMTHDDK